MWNGERVTQSTLSLKRSLQAIRPSIVQDIKIRIDGASGCPSVSLDFKHETHDTPVYQSAPVVNYPNEQLYTRVTEFKYLTGQEHTKTSIVYEFPK